MDLHALQGESLGQVAVLAGLDHGRHVKDAVLFHGEIPGKGAVRVIMGKREGPDQVSGLIGHDHLGPGNGIKEALVGKDRVLVDRVDRHAADVIVRHSAVREVRARAVPGLHLEAEPVDADHKFPVIVLLGVDLHAPGPALGVHDLQHPVVVVALFAVDAVLRRHDRAGGAYRFQAEDLRAGDNDNVRLDDSLVGNVEVFGEGLRRHVVHVAEDVDVEPADLAQVPRDLVVDRFKLAVPLRIVLVRLLDAFLLLGLVGDAVDQLLALAHQGGAAGSAGRVDADGKDLRTHLPGPADRLFHLCFPLGLGEPVGIPVLRHADALRGAVRQHDDHVLAGSVVLLLKGIHGSADRAVGVRAAHALLLELQVPDRVQDGLHAALVVEGKHVGDRRRLKVEAHHLEAGDGGLFAAGILQLVDELLCGAHRQILLDDGIRLVAVERILHGAGIVDQHDHMPLVHRIADLFICPRAACACGRHAGGKSQGKEPCPHFPVLFHDLLLYSASAGRMARGCPFAAS